MLANDSSVPLAIFDPMPSEDEMSLRLSNARIQGELTKANANLARIQDDVVRLQAEKTKLEDDLNEAMKDLSTANKQKAGAKSFSSKIQLY